MPIFYSDQNSFGLTWEDWCYTSKKKLALRHVTDKDRAERDRQGAQGADAASLVIPWLIEAHDSVNVNSVGLKEALQQRLNDIFLIDNLEEDSVFDFFKGHVLTAHKKFLDPTASLKIKQDALTTIFNCLLYFWVIKNERLFNNRDHFYLLIQHSNSENPYDFRKYPLGKCGSNGSWSKAVGSIYVTQSAHYNIGEAFSQITRLILSGRKGTVLPDKILTKQEMEKIQPVKPVDQCSVPTPYCSYHWGRISIAAGLLACGLYAISKVDPNQSKPEVVKSDICSKMMNGIQ